MAWSQARVEIVMEMASRHLSAAQIAEIVGTTRNAVIGLCHRKSIKLRQRPRANKVEKNDKSAGRRLIAKAAIYPAAKPPEDVLPFVARNVDVASKRISLIDLNPFHCRWPDDDPDTETGRHTFCGHIKQRGSSYCTAHTELSIGAGTRSERTALGDLRRLAGRVA